MRLRSARREAHGSERIRIPPAGSLDGSRCLPSRCTGREGSTRAKRAWGQSDRVAVRRDSNRAQTCSHFVRCARLASSNPYSETCRSRYARDRSTGREGFEPRSLRVAPFSDSNPSCRFTRRFALLTVSLYGPGGIRTPDRPVKSRTLSLTELPAHRNYYEETTDKRLEPDRLGAGRQWL